MDLLLNPTDRVRLTVYKDEVFTDIEAEPLGVVCITNTLHLMHKHVLKEKEGVIKLFSFSNKRKEEDLDFGWWADGKTIWKSF